MGGTRHCLSRVWCLRPVTYFEPQRAGSGRGGYNITLECLSGFARRSLSAFFGPGVVAYRTPRFVTDIESGSNDPRVPQGGPKANLSEGLSLESPALKVLEGGIHFGQRYSGGDAESPALGEPVLL